jgi:cytochrome c-type biogenesis protein CcmF
MNFGQILVFAAFILSSITCVAYYWDAKKRLPLPGFFSPARLFKGVLAVSAVASATLWYLIFSHQFKYSYVSEFSSLAQPMLYQVSAFWAGQEGTFLLWALLTSVMGWIFVKNTKDGDGYAMAVVTGYIAFLYLLMIVRSPFAELATAPADGSGMNPLLQDPWMAIHPPILFVGYAATVFPFALVVSALARRQYDHWTSAGFSWTLFASLMLGAGIIIGGFWAYEVLGWGGYWGWDPVENSSLVPWMVLLVLIHGLLIQKVKGALMRTNMFFAILSFVLVLYATFLTRSGVLSDFSVHSFVDLGINNYLVGILAAAVVIGYGLFATRFREIKSPSISIFAVNREVALLLSMFVLTAGALFTFAGMSSPILTGLFGKASQVDTPFYNKVNLPVAIVMALLLGVTPFLGWINERSGAILKRLSMPLALTALACVIAYVAGVTSIALMLFVGAAAFGVISNSVVAFRQYRSGWTGLGGPVAHIGVGLLLLGIVGSGSFDTTSQLVLKAGEPKQAFGYNFTFKGVEEKEGMKPQVHIEVSDGKTTFLATPKLYFSQQTQAMMREPDIKIFPLNDLYISPLEVKSEAGDHQHNPLFEFSKGQTQKIGAYDVTFTRFEVGTHEQSDMMSVGAVLSISVEGKKQEVVPQLMFNQRGERQMEPVNLPLHSAMSSGSVVSQIALNAINVEEKKALIEYIDPANQHTESSPQLLVEISSKPLMMVVWTGVVLIIAGTAVAFRRRLSPVQDNA